MSLWVCDANKKAPRGALQLQQINVEFRYDVRMFPDDYPLFPKKID